jgi:hypothetical protein
MTEAPEAGLFSLRMGRNARAALLALAILDLFVLPPLLDAGVIGQVHASAVYGLSLLAGVVAVGHRPSVRVLASVLVLAALGSHVLLLRAPGRDFSVADSALAMIVAGTFGVLVLAYALGKGPVTYHRVVGAVVAFLLVGVAWARAFHILVLLRPEALSLPSGKVSYGEMVYYSFATLTTLGYGSPVHPLARSMTMAEALTGLLYPPILIARLVNLQAPAGSGPKG